MKKIIDLMQNLGFGQYEAQVYLALLQQAHVTGYELARLSGVPASKIYAILNRLITKEVVLAIDSEPRKYVPVPPQDVLSRMKGDYLFAVHNLQDTLQQLYVQDQADSNYIWNITGRSLIIRKINDFIAEAREKLYLSVWDEEIDEISDAIQDAGERGLKIVIVHFGQKLLGLGIEYRHGREHEIRVERGGRRIALIADDRQVVLGHLQEDGSSNAAWTNNKSLVLLAKDYIIHDIYSIKIVQRFGDAATDMFEFKV
jgi:sugar-specific transcriptional regulator TrmB